MTAFRTLLTPLAGLALAVSLLAPTSASAAMKVEGKPKIAFFAVGSPGFLDIEGVGNAATVTDDGTKLVFHVPMSSVSSGIALRDTHMNEKYVETGKFPDAIMTVNKADITWPAATGEFKDGKIKGVFNIHGQDQPVDIDYNLSKTKTGYRVKAKWNFDVTKSGIEIPSYLGVTVDPKMKADVTIDLIDA